MGIHLYNFPNQEHVAVHRTVRFVEKKVDKIVICLLLFFCVDEIDISSVSDGVYIGEYDVNFIYAKVEVTVQNGKITGIDILEHKNERGQSAETLISEIVG